jgi:hypothetical protein
MRRLVFSGERRFVAGLIALFAMGFMLRVAAVFAIGSYRLEHITYEHGEIARNLIEGRGFTVRWLGSEGPTSQQAPVYPGIVAGFYYVFGVQSPAALLAIQLFQAGLGSLLPVAVVLVALHLVPARSVVAWLAGVGVAVYPTLIYAVTQVQVATVVCVLTLLLLYTAARLRRSGQARDAIACGVVAGTLVLTDPIMVLAVLVAVAMVVLRPVAVAPGWVRVWMHSRGRAAVMLSAFVATVSPWLMRNYLVHGELVFVKSTFGYAFWQGNHARSFGTDKIPLPRSSEELTDWGLRALERSLWRTRLLDTLYIDDAVLTNERIEELGRLPEPQRSRELMTESMAYIVSHPSHYIRLCCNRLRYFLLFDETNPKSAVRLYRLCHIVLQCLAVAGLWLSRKEWNDLWPTYALFVLLTAFHSLTIVSARFHLPLESVQCIWAGFACEACIRNVRDFALLRALQLMRSAYRSIADVPDISSGLSR